MKTVYVRNVDDAVVAKLDQTAKQKGISRSRLVKQMLENYTIQDGLKEAEERYAALQTNYTQAAEKLSAQLAAMQQEVAALNKNLSV